MSERHACRLMGLGRSTHRYRAQKAERDSELRTRLKELAAKRMRFGYRRLTAMLLRRRDAGQSQAGVPAVPRGRFGDEDSTTTADPLEWRGNSAQQRRGRMNAGRWIL